MELETLWCMECTKSKPTHEFFEPIGVQHHRCISCREALEIAYRALYSK